MPFLRRLHQSAPNRIQVNVFNDGLQRLWRFDIPIIAAPTLPKEAFRFAAALSCDSRKPLGRIFFQKSNCVSPDGFFNDAADLRNVILGRSRPDKNMGMFRHDYVRPHCEASVASGRFQTLKQPITRSFGTQKLQTLITRERQLMCVPLQIEVTTMRVLLRHRFYFACRWIYSGASQSLCPSHPTGDAM